MCYELSSKPKLHARLIASVEPLQRQSTMSSTQGPPKPNRRRKNSSTPLAIWCGNATERFKRKFNRPKSEKAPSKEQNEVDGYQLVPRESDSYDPSPSEITSRRVDIGSHKRLARENPDSDDTPVSTSGDTLHRRDGSAEIGTHHGFPTDPDAIRRAKAAAAARDSFATEAPSRGRKRQRGWGGGTDMQSEEKEMGEVNLEHLSSHPKEPAKAPKSERVESDFSLMIYTEEEMQAILKEKERLGDEHAKILDALELEKNNVKTAWNAHAHLMEEFIRQKEEHTHDMEAQKNQFLEEMQKLQDQHAEFNRQVWEEKALPDREKYQQEIDDLKDKLDELHASHIKSVNSVGTGLDPIADKTFEDKFRSIHDDFGDWCRRALKRDAPVRSLEEIDDPETKASLSTRLHDTSSVSPRVLMETTAWGYLERAILSACFPGVRPEHLKTMSLLEEDVRLGDTTKTLEKATFWRAYTSALLFQNPRVQSQLEQVDPQASGLLSTFNHVLRNPVTISDTNMTTLRKWLHSVVILAAELRCQRGVYEVDESVKLGDVYDDKRMLDVKFAVDDENPGHAVVSAVISRGVVKREFVGDTKVQAQICKTRVLVKIERVEDERRGEKEQIVDGWMGNGRPRGDEWIEMDEVD
ncbi:hypothetical protein K440DRAFT_663817 [Wilcoxina mikolae CBS 423.85]|nr:hypothetical protein K440DRAFT_663817 [Wilcoxina mikolae CBS 423.85]